MNPRSATARLALPALLLLPALAQAVAGCTASHVQTRRAEHPEAKPATLALEPLRFQDRLWEPLGPHFERGLRERLSEEQAFAEIFSPPPQPLGSSAVLLSGTITEVDKGSAALRWLVGFGAGKQKVAGTFRLLDPGGRTLAEFDAEESYMGGAGIGGISFLDMEDLMRKFGRHVAERVVRWSRGLPLAEEGPERPK